MEKIKIELTVEQIEGIILFFDCYINDVDFCDTEEIMGKFIDMLREELLSN